MRKWLLGIPALFVAILAAAVVWTGQSHVVAAAPSGLGPMTAMQTAYHHKVATIPVLAWHQVGHDCSGMMVCDAGNNDETVSLHQFDVQLDWLRAHGYQSVTADQYEGWVAGNDVALPQKPILLTFDDGTANSYVGTTEALEAHGYNAVTFIVSQFAQGATDGQRPFVGWDDTWDQLKALPANVWSFAFHAGAHGHTASFPQNKKCPWYYPCQQPGESAAAYKQRVMSEIAAGRAAEARQFGSRFNDQMWAVPLNDIAQQKNLPTSGSTPHAWLAKWAGTQFGMIFIQNPLHNGWHHERYRLEVHGTWTLSRFAANLSSNVRDGFFTRT